ncbi:MAG: hypothetical protein EHM23_36275 [Acidobacteria bacterium]|nr:MAG: hypothetical protein EHM23_36275 [Acidobacteriota bacterium]
MPAKNFWIEDWWPVLLIALLSFGWLLFSVISVLSASQKRRRKRVVFLSLLAASVPVALSILALTILFLVELGAYHGLTEWEVVARVQSGGRGRFGESKLRYTALAGGQERGSKAFDVYGDSWTVRADFIRWKPFMRHLGLTRSFKFSRLQGVYQREQDYREHPLTSETIGRGTDRIWQNAHGGQTPWPFGYFIESAYTASVTAPVTSTDLYDIIGTKEGLALRKVDY